MYMLISVSLFLLACLYNQVSLKVKIVEDLFVDDAAKESLSISLFAFYVEMGECDCLLECLKGYCLMNYCDELIF